MRSFLRDDDLNPAEQDQVLKLAAQMKYDPFAYRPLQGPRSVAVIFDKSSTRTRVSFAAGIAELGGNPIILDSANTQAKRGEPVEDTARVLGRMTRAIVWRTYSQPDLERMAAYAGVPVVNALSDDFHPCQILADLQTIREHKGTTHGLVFTYLGDGANNMAHSYLLGGATAGMHVRIACPQADSPSAPIVEAAERIAATTGGSVRVLHDARSAVEQADVIATDSWVSMGQNFDKSERAATMAPFSITRELISASNADAIILHCLPAYRGLEISEDVLEGPQSVVWDEAENRVHAQKALLAWLLSQSGES